jgi:hypothetical protein
MIGGQGGTFIIPESTSDAARKDLEGFMSENAKKTLSELKLLYRDLTVELMATSAASFEVVSSIDSETRANEKWVDAERVRRRRGLQVPLQLELRDDAIEVLGIVGIEARAPANHRQGTERGRNETRRTEPGAYRMRARLAESGLRVRNRRETPVVDERRARKKAPALPKNSTPKLRP